MTIYLAIVQPDGDWDHMADVLGVFSTRQLAKDVLKGYSDRGRVVKLTLDKKVCVTP